jgi:hypothetical protein
MSIARGSTCGTRVKGFLSAYGEPVSLAGEFSTHWQTRKGEALSPQLVAARLQSLLDDKPRGARFFFEEEPGRAELLSELLKIPPTDRLWLRSQAARLLSAPESQPRLVLELTRGPQEPEPLGSLFREIERRLLPSGILIALVLTESQARALPLAIAEREELRVCRATSPEQGKSLAEKLAGERALVASFQRFPVFSRWLALGFDKKGLVLEPPDALEVFFGQGELPSPAPVVEDLASLGVQPAPMSSLLESFLHNSAPHTRQVLWRLQSEAGAKNLKLSPESRLTIAKALGVKALATRREVIEIKVRRVLSDSGVPFLPREASPDEKDEALRRASLRPTQHLALWVGDELFLVNYPASYAAALREITGLHVLEIACAPAALSRLRDEIAGWSSEAREADPFLLKAASRLSAPGEEMLFIHAAASLLLTGALPAPVAAPRFEGSWKEALQSLLPDEIPPTSLRVQDVRPPQLVSPLGHRLPPGLVRRADLEGVETLLDFIPPPALRICTVSRAEAGSLVALSIRRTKLGPERRTEDDTLPRADLREFELNAPLRELERLEQRQRELLALLQVEAHQPSVQSQHAALTDELRVVEASLVEQLAQASLPMVLPLDESLIKDAERWLDLVEASSACGGALGQQPVWLFSQLYARKLLPPEVWRFPWKTHTLALEPQFEAADAMLPDLFLLLRRALSRGEAVKTARASWRIPLGGGLYVEAVFRNADAPPSAVFLARLEEERIIDPDSRREFYTPRLAPLGAPLQGASFGDEPSPEGRSRESAWRETLWRDPVWHQHERRTRDEAARLHLPRGLSLSGGGLVAELAFGYSALLAAV